MKENPQFFTIVSIHRILFHFLILFNHFEGRKMKQNAVGTVLFSCFSSSTRWLFYILFEKLQICNFFDILNMKRLIWPFDWSTNFRAGSGGSLGRSSNWHYGRDNDKEFPNGNNYSQHQKYRPVLKFTNASCATFFG